MYICPGPSLAAIFEFLLLFNEEVFPYLYVGSTSLSNYGYISAVTAGREALLCITVTYWQLKGENHWVWVFRWNVHLGSLGQARFCPWALIPAVYHFEKYARDNVILATNLGCQINMQLKMSCKRQKKSSNCDFLFWKCEYICWPQQRYEAVRNKNTSWLQSQPYVCSKMKLPQGKPLIQEQFSRHSNVLQSRHCMAFSTWLSSTSK